MKQKRRRRKRKCRHCGKMYLPDPRTADRQKHCSAPECKRASKAWRQRRWYYSEKGSEYRDSEYNKDRVRQWRKAHPGYWRRKPKRENALQDDCLSQPVDVKADKGKLGLSALQDDCLLEPPLVVGLIAQLTGTALQDDIAMAVRRMHAYGQSILGIGPGIETGGKDHDRQTSVVPGTGASHS